MSITDEILSKAPDQTMKAAGGAKGGLKSTAGVVKGICLLLVKCADFSEATVMQAVKNVALKKTGDIKYSKNNIDIAKLRESGNVYRVEDNVLADVMGAFDKQCKKYGIKYSAMIDTKDEGKPGYQPSYMVFFEGRDDSVIMNALAEAYVEYEKHQKAKTIAEDVTPQEEKGKKGRRWGRKNNQEKENPEQRESVKAKLAFFRDRVAARDKESDAVEKHHQHDDRSR